RAELLPGVEIPEPRDDVRAAREGASPVCRERERVRPDRAPERPDQPPARELAERDRRFRLGIADEEARPVGRASRPRRAPADQEGAEGGALLEVPEDELAILGHRDRAPTVRQESDRLYPPGVSIEPRLRSRLDVHEREPAPRGGREETLPVGRE